MSDLFNDDRINAKMGEFENIIDEIEDHLRSLKDEEAKILEYLNDIKYSLPLGYCIRKYICEKFSKGFDSKRNRYVFVVGEKDISVGNFDEKEYDLTKDDIEIYVKIFSYVNKYYNTDAEGKLALNMPVSEMRRLLQSTTACKRSTLFILSFALHMSPDTVIEFLTKVLGEQGYNLRNPDEVIAYFCHSHDKINNYVNYLRIKEEYEKRLSRAKILSMEQPNYTMYAKANLAFNISSEGDLYGFLISNRANFNKFSKTAYQEFKSMYEEVMEIAKVQDLSNDSYLNPNWADSERQRIEHEGRVSKAIELHSVRNTEQLAKRMLSFIPRSTTERITKSGERVLTDDFISISNKSSDKKVQTTMLPKEITENLLTKDRLDDLIKGVKPVDRKALILLKFFIFSLELEEMEINFYAKNPNAEFRYSATHAMNFLDDCDSMLSRCGMAKLYAANRFDNLVLISLVSSKPYEMFEQIIENSFIHEPEALA